MFLLQQSEKKRTCVANVRCVRFLVLRFSSFASVTLHLRSASWTFLASRSFRRTDLSRWEKPRHNLLLRSYSSPFKWINDDSVSFYASFFTLSLIKFPKHPGLLWVAIFLSGPVMHEWDEFCALLWREWWLSSDEPLCQYNEAPVRVCVCVCYVDNFAVPRCLLCVSLWGNIVFWLRPALLFFKFFFNQETQDKRTGLFSSSFLKIKIIRRLGAMLDPCMKQVASHNQILKIHGWSLWIAIGRCCNKYVMQCTLFSLRVSQSGFTLHLRWNPLLSRWWISVYFCLAWVYMYPQQIIHLPPESFVSYFFSPSNMSAAGNHL